MLHPTTLLIFPIHGI